MVPDVYLVPLNQNEILLVGGHSSPGRKIAGDFYPRGLARLTTMDAESESFIVDTVCANSYNFEITTSLDYWSFNRATNNVTTFS